MSTKLLTPMKVPYKIVVHELFVTKINIHTL